MCRLVTFQYAVAISLENHDHHCLWYCIFLKYIPCDKTIHVYMYYYTFLPCNLEVWPTFEKLLLWFLFSYDCHLESLLILYFDSSYQWFQGMYLLFYVDCELYPKNITYNLAKLYQGTSVFYKLLVYISRLFCCFKFLLLVFWSLTKVLPMNFVCYCVSFRLSHSRYMLKL